MKINEKARYSRNLVKIKNSISSLLESDPNLMLPALQAFNSTAEKIKNHSQLVSAFHTFGKYSGIHVNSKSNKGSKIGLQPESVARRKSTMPGKRFYSRGKPSNKFLLTFSKSISNKYKNHSKAVNMPNKKAPHSLNVCVEQNRSLGSRHT